MYSNHHNRTVQADDERAPTHPRTDVDRLGEGFLVLLFTDPASILDRKERTADQDIK